MQFGVSIHWSRQCDQLTNSAFNTSCNSETTWYLIQWSMSLHITPPCLYPVVTSGHLKWSWLVQWSVWHVPSYNCHLVSSSCTVVSWIVNLLHTGQSSMMQNISLTQSDGQWWPLNVVISTGMLISERVPTCQVGSFLYLLNTAIYQIKNTDQPIIIIFNMIIKKIIFESMRMRREA